MSDWRDDAPTDDAGTDEWEALDPSLDHAVAADEWGTTEAEEELGESLEQRMLREEPEARWSGDDDEGTPIEGRLVQPDAGSIDLDDVAEEVAEVADDPFGLSAEEAAIRIETDPAGLGRGPDGYIDGS